MLTISVKTNFDQVMRNLEAKVKAKAPKAAAIALNETLVIAKNAVVDEMRRVFDRPTPWTLNSMRIRRAGPSKLTGTIYFRDSAGKGTPAAKYISTQIGGGQRRQKRFEKALQALLAMPQGWIAVPGEAARLDAYGNMSAGQIKQILSAFNAAEMTSGYSANRTQRSIKRRKNLPKFFAVMPNSGSHLHPGIWQRFSFAVGSAIKPIMMFVPAARYQPRLNFRGVVGRVVATEFNRQFAAALKVVA